MAVVGLLWLASVSVLVQSIRLLCFVDLWWCFAGSLVLMVFALLITFNLISALIRSSGIYVPGDSMTLTTALIVLNVVITTTLLIITITTQPSPNTTHIVNEARTFVLTWFTAILVLSLLTIMEPPAFITTILLILIIVITIDTAIYVTLTTTIINHLKTQTPIDHNV